MTQSYKQIQRQIESLQRQAEKLRQREVAGVVERIKVAIEHYGLTASQLGFSKSAADPAKRERRSAPSKTAARGAARYTDGNGNTWSGRGPRPRWLKEAIAAGQPLSSLGVGGAAAAKAAPATASKTKRRAKTQYGDQNGNSWSGMGPKPRWLKDALAAGAALEQFTR